MPRVTVSFATNRNPIQKRRKIQDFGPDFNPHGLDELRFGLFRIDTTDAEEAGFTSGEKVEGFVANERAPEIETFDERIEGARRLPGSAKLFSSMRDLMASRGRDTLVYVHGYNTTFRGAAATTYALQWFLRTQAQRVGLGPAGMNVLCFTWPSDGGNTPWIDYRDDRRDARASGPAFARAFLKLRDFLVSLSAESRCEQRVHLLCHSMGNFVLQCALGSLREHIPGPLPRIFDQVVLLAADVDSDALEQEGKLKRLSELAKRIAVYTNTHDKALFISDTTKANPDRLGQDGPANLALIPDKVEVIDTSSVVTGLVKHGYHTQNRILADLANTLAGRPGDQYMGSSRRWDERRRRWVLT